MLRLEGKISYLVPFVEAHMNSEDYFNWLQDYEVMKTINRLDYLRPVSFAEVKGYCETVMQSQNDIFLAMYERKDDLFIGTIRIKIDWYTRTADVGILIGNRNYWGKGIATDSIFAVSTYLLNKLGMRKLTAGFMEINGAMRRVFEQLGFRVEGVFRKTERFEGQYVDHIYMGCFKDEFQFDLFK